MKWLKYLNPMNWFSSIEPIYSKKQIKQITPICDDYWLVSVIYSNQVLSFSTAIKQPQVFCRLVNNMIAKQLGDRYKSVRPFVFHIDESTNNIVYLIDYMRNKHVLDAILTSLLRYISDDAKEYIRDSVTYSVMVGHQVPDDIKATDFVPRDFDIDIVHEGQVLNRYSIHLSPNENKVRYFAFLLNCLYCEEEGTITKDSIDKFRVEARYHDYIISLAHEMKALVLKHDHLTGGDRHYQVFNPKEVKTIDGFIPPRFNIKQCRNGDFIYVIGG